MAEKPEEIEKEIRDTREALGEKVDALAGQIREGVETARKRGLRVAGILVATVAGILTLRRLRRRKRSEE